jgi:hypothetical protein
MLTSSSCFFRWWTARFLPSANDLPHHTICNCVQLSYADWYSSSVQTFCHSLCIVQLYGFLPMWTSTCFLRWLLLANELPHTVQLYGFSPMWTLICWFSCWLCANDLSHNLWSIIYIRWSNSWINKQPRAYWDPPLVKWSIYSTCSIFFVIISLLNMLPVGNKYYFTLLYGFSPVWKISYPLSWMQIQIRKKSFYYRIS